MRCERDVAMFGIYGVCGWRGGGWYTLARDRLCLGRDEDVSQGLRPPLQMSSIREATRALTAVPRIDQCPACRHGVEEGSRYAVLPHDSVYEDTTGGTRADGSHAAIRRSQTRRSRSGVPGRATPRNLPYGIF